MNTLEEARQKRHLETFTKQIALMFENVKTREPALLQIHIRHLQSQSLISYEEANPILVPYGYGYVEGRPFEWHLEKKPVEPQFEAESNVNVRLVPPTIIAVDTVPTISKKKTNFNSDGQSIAGER